MSGWGAPAGPVTDGWGSAATADAAPQKDAGGWGAPAATAKPAAPSGWGAPATPADSKPAADSGSSGWGAPSDTAARKDTGASAGWGGGDKASNGWGASSAPAGGAEVYVPSNMRGGDADKPPPPGLGGDDTNKRGPRDIREGCGDQSGGWGSSGGGGGWGGSAGGGDGDAKPKGRSVAGFGEFEENEDDPFKLDAKRREEADRLFSKPNTGINFDAYENIPVDVSGKGEIPQAIGSFEAVASQLGEHVMENLKRCGYTQPTPVQKFALPIALAGRDIMGAAQTGSGKTAAFGLPIIANIIKSGWEPSSRSSGYGQQGKPVCLILAPTRELAQQINEEIRKYIFNTSYRSVCIYGGCPGMLLSRDMEKGCDFLVATPGRVTDFIEKAKVSMEKVKYLILDEADRMLDMGFEPQVRRIVDGEDMPSKEQRQTLMFSATFPKDVQKLAGDFLNDYLFLSIGRVGSTTDLVSQNFVYCTWREKNDKLAEIVDSVEGLTLVFCASKKTVDDVVVMLNFKGHASLAIHGDKEQHERNAALKAFRNAKIRVLVATDVASRGLDIPHVSHVINFDMPNDVDSYVHRIGRTGRMGRKGMATAFYNERDEGLAEGLVELLKESKQEVPDFLVNGCGGYGGGRGGGRSRDFRSGGDRQRHTDTPADSSWGSSAPAAAPAADAGWGPPAAAAPAADAGGWGSKPVADTKVAGGDQGWGPPKAAAAPAAGGWAGGPKEAPKAAAAGNWGAPAAAATDSW